jgi:hypothetical protein
MDHNEMKKATDKQLDTFLANARFYLEVGYFDGALQICKDLERHSEKYKKKSFHIAWLTRIYLGGKHRNDALKMLDIISVVNIYGVQCLTECAVLAAHVGEPKLLAYLIERILHVAKEQHGVLVLFHPSALLELAEFALDKLQDKASALKLVNCALGFRAVFMVLSDVERLGGLLSKLKAPLPLWADWAAIYVQHIKFCSQRPQLFHRMGDQIAVKWALAQDQASEGVLSRTIKVGPPRLLELLIRIAPQLGAAAFATVLENKQWHCMEVEGSYTPADAIWFDPEILKLRYFWFDMLTESERHMIQNGDWAMFSTPTPDFSMALAQWWRVIESTLKRTFVKDLVKLFKENPEWIEWDKTNLSPQRQKDEALFIEILTDARKAQLLTLGDIIKIFAKCTRERPEGSRLRKGASIYFKQNRDFFEPLVLKGHWNTELLTIENVKFFRNRSSHDLTSDIIDSSIGRFVGKRIMDLYFAPFLKDLGFVPSIHIPE